VQEEAGIMLYVYDTLLDESVDTLQRYGVTFHREKRFRMGNAIVYTFGSTGGEKILAIPIFAEQYKQVEAKFNRFGKNKTYEEYLKLIRNRVDAKAFEEEIRDADSSTGKAMLVTARYKDIQIAFQYMNGVLTYHDEFTICANNPFGLGDVVWMNENTEDEDE
jgi:hypothetical protein